MKSAFDILEERGLVENTTDPDAVRKLLAHPPVSFYVGFDPTADSLHVGHLLPIITMAHLQRAGHRPIAVVGGGTGMVGDPSGKTELREILSVRQIRQNLEAQKKQLQRFLDFDSDHTNVALMINNADWLLSLKYIDFLREIGVHFTVNRMLAAECFKQRWEKGLTFIEFNYMLLQAYDFLELYRREKCRLQIGGGDQWGNILAGADLIRRIEGGEAHGLVVPLLLTASGKKFGKTEKGAVWLAAERTSPYDFYQYWRNVDDKDVEKCLRMLTFIPMDEVRELASVEPGSALNEAKKRLAFELTKLVHGQAAAETAGQAAEELFVAGREVRESVDGVPAERALETLETDRQMSTTEEVMAAGMPIIDALVGTKLASTRSEARRLIEQGGAYINDARVDSIEQVLTLNDAQRGRILLRSGKKKHGLIVVRSETEKELNHE